MLSELEMRYEAHEKSKVVLCPGLTALIGSNDNGKSSVQRAIRWVATNNPRGDEMIPWEGEKVARVTAITSGAKEVTRLKGKGKNIYTVNGTNLAALGAAVPEEVTDILNLDETNIQAQVDQYFLLQASPGAVAKRINEVAGISDSDSAIKRTNELISLYDKEVKGLTADVKKFEGYIEEHSGVIDQAVASMYRMENTESSINADTVAINMARAFSADVKSTAEKVAIYPDYEKIEKELEVIDELEREVEEQTKRRRVATDLRVQLTAVDLARFDFLGEIDIDSMEAADREVSKMAGRLQQSKAIRDELRGLIEAQARFQDLDVMFVKLAQMAALELDVAADEDALAPARELSTQIHETETGKFECLSRAHATLEDIQNAELKQQELSKYLQLLEAISRARGLVSEAENDISTAKSALLEMGALCESCGQIIEEEA